MIQGSVIVEQSCHPEMVLPKLATTSAARVIYCRNGVWQNGSHHACARVWWISSCCSHYIPDTTPVRAHYAGRCGLCCDLLKIFRCRLISPSDVPTGLIQRKPCNYGAVKLATRSPAPREAVVRFSQHKHLLRLCVFECRMRTCSRVGRRPPVLNYTPITA